LITVPWLAPPGLQPARTVAAISAVQRARDLCDMAAPSGLRQTGLRQTSAGKFYAGYPLGGKLPLRPAHFILSS
jgi:hypothetical protein